MSQLFYFFSKKKKMKKLFDEKFKFIFEKFEPNGTDRPVVCIIQ